MLRPKQRNLLIGTFAVLAVIALAVVPGLRHSPSSLLTHAHKVATLNDSTAKPSNYFWLSNHEVLLIATAGHDAESISQETQAHRLDIQTGTIKEDRPLEAALNNVGPDTAVLQWQLSPDTCWLLSDDSYLQNTPPALIVTAVNGTKQFTRSRHEEYMRDGIFTVWRRDGRSLSFIDQNTLYTVPVD